MLSLIEGEPKHRRVSADNEVFQLEFGFEAEEDYPPSSDVMIIQLIEEGLMKLIEACDGLGDAKPKLMKIVEDWTTESVVPEEFRDQ